MTPDLIRQVWTRAGRRCEYCHLPADVYPLPFHVDHIIALQHGGQSVLENLALACLHCNRHKGPNIAGVDQIGGLLVQLFHPRQDDWSVHFRWREYDLDGRTPTGRVTVQVLAINDPDFTAVRAALIIEGAFHRE